MCVGWAPMPAARAPGFLALFVHVSPATAAASGLNSRFWFELPSALSLTRSPGVRFCVLCSEGQQLLRILDSGF